MNETTTQVIHQATETYPDPMTGIVLVAVALMLFLFGLVTGAIVSRPGIPRARVRLRALKAYLSSGVADDELVQSLLRLEIRRLENRLKLDDDQD